jgi:hypothetical protein
MLTHQGMTAGVVNEFTTATKVKFGHVPLLRFALQHSGPLAMEILKSILTIHYAQWLVVPMNGSDYLLFITRYNGSFEKYIDDFATTFLLGKGLDGIWMNTEGYPGVKSAEKLKDFIRETTFGADIFYAAYPQATVRDVLRSLDRVSAAKTLFDIP